MDYENYDFDTAQTTTSCNYTLGYIFLGLFIIVSGVLGYIFFSYDLVDKGDLSEKYILKDEVIFENLPYEIQDQYIAKYNASLQLNRLKEKLNSLKKQDCKPEIITKTIEVEKPVEKIITKIIEKPIYKKEKIDKSHYSTFKCYDMSDVIYPSSQCKKDLKLFMQKNKDARLFEVIGVYNTHGFNTLENLKNIHNKKRIDKITNLAQLGLSQKRASEGVWVLKEIAPKDANIQVVNYSIKEPNDKGFIVRAYK